MGASEESPQVRAGRWGLGGLAVVNNNGTTMLLLDEGRRCVIAVLLYRFPFPVPGYKGRNLQQNCQSLQKLREMMLKTKKRTPHSMR